MQKLMVMGKCILCGTSKPNEVAITSPILWRVIREEGSRKLLLSEYCLDWDFYDGSEDSWGAGGDITWAASDMREYLNHVFYEESFTVEEKKRIQMTVVETSDNPEFHTRGGAVVEDAVFLLSAEEVQQYLDASEAKALLVMADPPLSGENTAELLVFPQKWWLRTPGMEQNQVACVDENGRIDLEGIHCNADEVGIRPAMWIQVNNEE